MKSNTDNQTPGACINNNFSNRNENIFNHNAAEKLLQEFNIQLADHKKKQQNLIQSFMSSNAKFDEVTSYFMNGINPTLKSTADQYRAQNQLLMDENKALKMKISSYEQQLESIQKQSLFCLFVYISNHMRRYANHTNIRTADGIQNNELLRSRH